jgi:hypothetical protein
MITAALLSLSLAAAPFPLPTVDGKALPVQQDQKVFRLPMSFSKVKAFYEQQLGKAEGVKLVSTSVDGQRVLKLSTKNKEYLWTSATVRESEVETIVELKQVIQVGPTEVTGNGPPVQFIFTRSTLADDAVKSIDHTEQMRSR